MCIAPSPTYNGCHLNVCTRVGFNPARGSSFFFEKMTTLGELCCVVLCCFVFLRVSELLPCIYCTYYVLVLQVPPIKYAMSKLLVSLTRSTHRVGGRWVWLARLVINSMRMCRQRHADIPFKYTCTSHSRVRILTLCAPCATKVALMNN